MDICYYEHCNNTCKGKFCSGSCRGKHYAEIRFPTSERKKCATCGTNIRNTRKYCSKECRVNKPVTQKNFMSYQELKVFCLEYKGNKCSICGYNKCNAALQFHHNDSSLKKYSISALCSRNTISPLLLEELDKCTLLCANCHAEVHNCSD